MARQSRSTARRRPSLGHALAPCSAALSAQLGSAADTTTQHRLKRTDHGPTGVQLRRGLQFAPLGMPLLAQPRQCTAHGVGHRRQRVDVRIAHAGRHEEMTSRPASSFACPSFRPSQCGPPTCRGPATVCGQPGGAGPASTAAGAAQGAHCAHRAKPTSPKAAARRSPSRRSNERPPVRPALGRCRTARLNHLRVEQLTVDLAHRQRVIALGRPDAEAQARKLVDVLQRRIGADDEQHLFGNSGVNTRSGGVEAPRAALKASKRTMASLPGA